MFKGQYVVQRRLRVRNQRVNKKCGNKTMADRAREGMLKWTGDKEKMNEENLTKRVCV